ncbi:hypothetical protein JW979_04235 [bacterium]|nr:hypothetical protein [candidate division CSSED10-310 bacterium]
MGKFAFLDTNIFLHYQPFDQINWLDVLKAPQVTIVLTTLNVRELNKTKDTHHSPRIRDRAGWITIRLDKLFEKSLRAELRHDVEMIFETREPGIDFNKFGLVKDVNDDNLIANILMFKEEKPDSEIVLITSDSGLTLIGKAKRLGISTIRLPQKYKLQEEPDPEKEIIKKLEKENLELKSKIPKLTLLFENRKNHMEFNIQKQIEIDEYEIDAEIRMINIQYPKMSQETPRKSGISQNLSPGDLNFMLVGTITSADIENYNTKLIDFYRQYREYLLSKIGYKNLQSRTIQIDILVSNEGSTPAEDIDVYLNFANDGIRLMDSKRYPNEPNPPDPPEKPESSMKNLYNSLSGAAVAMPYLASKTPNRIQPPMVSPYTITRGEEGYELRFHVISLKHKFVIEADTLFVIFESYEKAKSFQIDYEIFAGNMLEKTPGELHVIINKEEH